MSIEFEKAPASPIGVSLETGLDYNPATLAKEARKSNVKNQLFALPLPVCLAASIAMILALVIIPSSSVFVTNAKSNVEENANTLLRITAQKTVSNIDSLMEIYRSTAYNFGARASTRDRLLNNVDSAYEHLTSAGNDWRREMADVLKSYPDIATIVCISNDFANNDPPKITQIAMDNARYPRRYYRSDGSLIVDSSTTFTFDWMDTRDTNEPAVDPDLSQNFWPLSYIATPNPPTYKTAGQIYYSNLLDDQGQFFTQEAVDELRRLEDVGISYPKAAFLNAFQKPKDPLWWVYNPSAYLYNATWDGNYQYMKVNPTHNAEGKWAWAHLGGDSIYWSVVVNVWAHDNSALTQPTHACQSGGYVGFSIDPFLRDDLPSPNAVMFMYDPLRKMGDNSKGHLIASSVPGSVTKGINATTTIKGTNLIDLAPDVQVSQVGKFLRQQYPELDEMPRGLLTFKATLDDGRPWYIATADIETGDGNRWQFVLAFPRDDFFQRIDQSIMKSITVIACLSVAAVLIAIGASFLCTIPLRMLGKRMAEVTQMKFGSLEDGALDKRSFIREIAHLEETFAIMVKAFAAGIRKNADLVVRRPGSASGISGTQNAAVASRTQVGGNGGRKTSTTFSAVIEGDD
ncbi:hypothetical protein HDU85_006665 [Gaertneriomyces sp. JEL0708]|nr:hypothetical protein HDU85_006665 [Gaertneriomyces sp. JEL0708]